MTQPSNWQVRLFGPLRIDLEGADVRAPAGKARSLLAWLLLHPDAPQTRDAVIDALWQDHPLDRARRTLSDTLYRLRESPFGAWVVSDGDLISLAPGLSLHVDLWDFQRLARAKNAAEMDAALALVSGALLPEIYDDWIVVRRVALQDQYLLLLHRRAALAEGEGDQNTAHRCFQQIIEIDNLDESAWRGRMRVLARMGHAREALDIYERLEALLEEELGGKPEGESQELAKQIGSELDAQSRASSTLPVFVGRTRERSRLLAALDDAVAGKGGLSVLLGAAGMGRTALLNEIEQSARWRGVQVVWGRGSDGGYPRPFAPFADALQNALPEVRQQQLGDLVRSQWIDALALLLPQVADTLPGVATPASPLHDLGEVALALGAVLGALGKVAPHLFLLDDMQWADPSLWDLLDELRHHLIQSRVLILLSSRTSEEHQDGSVLRQRLERWERESAISVQSLAGLTVAELEQLLVHRKVQLAPDRLAATHRDSGGNPALALTLASMQGGVSSHSGEERVRQTLLNHFNALPPDERDALQLGAVLGSRFAWRAWSALWRGVGRAAHDLPLLAGRLEQKQHLTLAGSDYAFASHLLQAAVYGQIGPESVSSLHRDALRALQSVEGVAPGQLLRHAELGELEVETVHYALLAGKNASAAFSFQSARAYFALGIAHLRDHAALDRYALLLGQADVLEVLGEREEQAGVLADLAALAQQGDDQQRILDVANRSARYALVVGTLDAGLATAEAALKSVKEGEHVDRVARLHSTVAAIHRERKQPKEALQHAEIARQLYRAVGDEGGVAALADFAGGLAYDSGDYRTAAQRHLEAANLFAAIGDILGEARCLNNLGSVYWELGDFEGARTTHERALLLCRASGDKRGEGDNIDNLGGVYWSLGDYDGALQHYRAALQLRRAIRDEWGVGISLGNVASALLNQGSPLAALEYYAEAYALYQRNGRRRSEAYALHHMALAYAQLGDGARALDLLAQALAMRIEIGDPSKTIESNAAMATLLVSHPPGESKGDASASDFVNRALAELASGDYPAALQQEVHFAAWRVAASEGNAESALLHLGMAEVALEKQCAPLSAEARHSFLANVPLNRDLIEALAPHRITTNVTCASKDARRGRALHADEQITLCWTVATPGDALFADSTLRRQRVLRRLLAEAESHNAAPSDDLLANALGVSRRTILRDMAALEAEGVVVSSRFRG